MPDNPFSEIESLLQKPAATGVCVTWLSRTAAPAGLNVGDILTEIDGKPLVAMSDFYRAMQPKGKDDTARKLKLKRAGREVAVEIPAGLRGFNHCWVAEGKRGWDSRPDTDYTPDFSALRGGEIWLRNSLDDKLAGFEMLRIKSQGEFIDVDTLFRLGGGDKPEEVWDYRTRGSSRHRLDKHLSVVKTAFWEGAIAAEKLKGDVSLGDDGQWRGTHVLAEGEKQVTFAQNTPRILTAYTATLLPLTMPLKEGASLTYFGANDGVGIATSRHRVECLGRRKIEYQGKQAEAWCFASRHYGVHPDEEDEKFFVDDKRRLLRIDWGPNYGNCWCELVDGPQDLKGLPAHVKVE